MDPEDSEPTQLDRIERDLAHLVQTLDRFAPWLNKLERMTGTGHLPWGRGK